MDSVRVAVVQAGSLIMERAATVEKAVRLVEEAAAGGAKLILFPEAFVGGYPWGLALGTVIGGRTAAGRRDWARYWQGAIPVPGAEVEVLAAAAQKAQAYVIVGVIERSALGTGTLYCTTLYFGPSGQLLAKHRKLKPTAMERLIWGEGDGSTLPVIPTPYGRLGGLICWEHYMPLARAAMLAKGIDIWVAPTMDEREVWQCTIRHLANEGRCFVLSAIQYLTKSMYPPDLACRQELDSSPEVLCDGGSAIVDPLGNYVAGPVRDREVILYGDLDLSTLAQSRFDLDVTGHYARPDVFELRVDERPRPGVTTQPGPPGP